MEAIHNGVKVPPIWNTIMLKSYEAIYENGQFKWLTEQPEMTTARVIITVLEDTSSRQPRRTFPVPAVG